MTGLTDDRETCSVSVNRGDYRWTKLEACGRPVKDEGLCGLHLAAKRRRDQKDAEMRESWAFSDKIKAEADDLGAALGTHVTAHYDWQARKYDGRFVVNGDWLRAQVTG